MSKGGRLARLDQLFTPPSTFFFAAAASTFAFLLVVKKNCPGYKVSLYTVDVSCAGLCTVERKKKKKKKKKP